MTLQARNFHAQPEYDDEDDYPIRRPNVPGSLPRPVAPGYRNTQPRLLGEPMPQGRTVNVPPQPLPNSRPRTSAGIPVVQGRTYQALPQPAPRINTRASTRSLPNWLTNLNLNNLLNLRVGLYVVGGVVGLVLFTLLVTNVINWWNTWQDDMTYGRPRTMQVDGWVGHNEQTGSPTHFIAQNVNGEINVFEIPGGDTSKTVVIKGPRIFAKNADLVPVKIRLDDVNADGHVDLVVSADGRQLVYLNDSGRFRPATDNEFSKLRVSGGN